jgi:hypothetical protein
MAPESKGWRRIREMGESPYQTTITLLFFVENINNQGEIK